MVWYTCSHFKISSILSHPIKTHGCDRFETQLHFLKNCDKFVDLCAVAREKMTDDKFKG